MITVEGERAVLAKLNSVMSEVDVQKERALMKAGMKVVATAQRNLRTAGHNGGTVNTTGQLSQSGKVQKEGDDVVAGFFSSGSDQGHAAIVEFGSTKKWFPPLKYLEEWAHKKLGLVKKDASRAAFLIALTIAGRNPNKPGVHGLKPHPFFKPALDANRKEIEAIVGHEIGIKLK